MFDEVLNFLLHEVLTALPTLELYFEMFGMSSIGILKVPLTKVYVEFIQFALLAIKLYDRSTSRKFLILS